MNKKTQKFIFLILMFALITCSNLKDGAEKTLKIKNDDNKIIKNDSVKIQKKIKAKEQITPAIEIRKIENIGKQMFFILTQYKMLSRSKFKEYFLSHEEIIKLRDSEYLGLTKKEKQQAPFFKISKNAYFSSLENEYIKIYEELESNKIDTKKLVFEEFVFQENKTGKLKVINGVLVFSYKDEKYGLDSIAVQVAPSRYQLVSIGPKLLQ